MGWEASPQVTRSMGLFLNKLVLFSSAGLYEICRPRATMSIRWHVTSCPRVASSKGFTEDLSTLSEKGQGDG